MRVRAPDILTVDLTQKPDKFVAYYLLIFRHNQLTQTTMLSIIRTNLEDKLLNFAKSAIMISFYTPIKTAMGDIDLIAENGTCMQDIDGDWIFRGSVHDLTDEDFMKVYDSALEKAKELLEMCE